MAADENSIVRRVQLATAPYARLHRMQAGIAWAGATRGRETATRTVTLRPGDVLIRDGMPVRLGPEGMSDLGGWTPRRIEPVHVGATWAVSTWMEVKTATGRPTPQQLAFGAAVTRDGGLFGVVRSEGEALAIVRPSDPLTNL